ncbi:MAG: ATP-binding protein, partial [Gemmatimonadetes bacterium]|nr:ATP-binding protein [Gemmatimonadota bacterium]
RQGVALSVSPETERARVWVDAEALRQVLANLFDNAVRHTPSGGRLTVMAQTQAGRTSIMVADTGTGIPAEHLPRIFERFYRADPARSRDQGGTGLGLAIVKHLVEAHGGEVTAESTLGRGTTIRLSLPAGPRHTCAGARPPGPGVVTGSLPKPQNGVTKLCFSAPVPVTEGRYAARTAYTPHDAHRRHHHDRPDRSPGPGPARPAGGHRRRGGLRRRGFGHAGHCGHIPQRRWLDCLSAQVRLRRVHARVEPADVQVGAHPHRAPGLGGGAVGLPDAGHHAPGAGRLRLVRRLRRRGGRALGRRAGQPAARHRQR